MASVYDLKPRFQALLRPRVEALAARGVTANQVTVLAFLLSCLVGWLVRAGAEFRFVFFVVPVFLFVRMALNAIDGMLAREHGQKSNLGAMLNELGDVFSDVVFYAPFMLAIGAPVGLAFGVVTLSMATEMAGVVAVQIGASRRYDGPMGKSDRAFVFGILAIVCGITRLSFEIVVAILGVISVALTATLVNRVRRALAEAEENRK